MSEFNKEAFLEHIRMHRNENLLDIAQWAWGQQQTIIDDLKAQLNNMEAAAKNDLEAMKDPNNVHNLMIRGVIGTPALMQCLHLHGSEAIERWNRIDQLKSQLNNMEQCYIQKKKQVEAVSHMLEGDLKYVEQDLRGNFEFLKMAMIRCLGDALKALRGEHE